MKKLILFFLCLCVFTNYLVAQKSDTISKCSQVLTDLSYFWKLDSLGTNGFRLYSFKKISNSKLDSIHYKTLFEKLGKPNNILKSTTDVVYIYHYFNASLIPYKMICNCILTIEFTKKNESDCISNCFEWVIDL